MTNRVVDSVIALTAVTAMLSLAPVTAQRAQRGAADQAGASQSGCPDEPAKFHPCAIEKEKTFDSPRTADGKPDFQGYWAPGIQAFDIETHPERPWSLAYPVKRVKDKGFEIMEFACHEGNRSMDLQLNRK